MPGSSITLTACHFTIERALSGPAIFPKGATGYFLVPGAPTEEVTGTEVTLNYFLCANTQFKAVTPSEGRSMSLFPISQFDYMFTPDDLHVNPVTYFSMSSKDPEDTAEQSPPGDSLKAAPEE